uniref:AlNc14C201G8708 protein n=1 Tax=Albugo laibachii Nc14 TaxID=890382 RepID=F0WQP8_9STRA|nr:AlNc14C201G8708 [Albugo laibachii Nc14]|eukprot:CCA23657.1 AlNc14C201G8708 [Albugo laibachii Nc14]
MRSLGIGCSIGEVTKSTNIAARRLPLFVRNSSADPGTVESNVSTVNLREFLVAIDHAETNLDTVVNSFADKLGIFSDASATTTKINASVLHALRKLSPQGEPLMRIWPDPAAPNTMSRLKNRDSIAIYLRIVRSFVDFSVQFVQ